MIYNNTKIKADFLEYLKHKVGVIQKPLILSIVQIGDDLASSKYIQIKKKIGLTIGIDVVLEYFEYTVDYEEVNNYIQKNTFNVQGRIYQLPIPDIYNELVNTIPAHIDVDMLGHNQEVLWRKGFLPPTIGAIDLTLKDILNSKDYDNVDEFINTKIDLTNKIVAIIGQGKLVGKPLLKYFSDRNATIISLNKDTRKPNSLTQLADIVICAAGSKGLVNNNWIKPNAVIIDAATSEDNGSLVGDVDRERIPESAILSPSPGGIGGLTVLYLFYNLIQCQISF